MQKLLTFFSKNIRVYGIFNDQNFNDTLTDDIISFEQPGLDNNIGTNCLVISLSLNPFMPSGQVHLLYKESLVGFHLLPYFEEISVLNANSVDPDRTPRSAASDQGLQCLTISLLRR